jgi:hypothetical protein
MGNGRPENRRYAGYVRSEMSVISNKHFWPITAIALVAMATASDGDLTTFRYVDAKRNLTVLAHGGLADQVAPGSYLLQLKGSVSIASVSQGLSLTSHAVRCETSTDGKKRSELRHAVATGDVHIVKRVSTAGRNQTTDLRSSAGDLRAETGGDIIKLAGPVRIESTDAVRHQTMLAIGSSGTVTLEPDDKNRVGNGLRSGSLEGPVTVTLDGSPPKGSLIASRVVATSDRMELRNTDAEPTIVLIGHVEIHGKGDQGMGDFTRLSRATLKLNRADQVVGWEAGAPLMAMDLGHTTAGTASGMQQGEGSFPGVDGQILIHHFARTKVDTINGIVELSGAGGVVTVEDTGLGLKMSAKSMDCTLVANDAGQYVVSKATIDGDGEVWMDSKKADKARAAAAVLAHRVPPPSPKGSSKLHLVSNHIDYAVSKAETVITFPGPVDSTDDSEGTATRVDHKQKVDVTYTQTTHVSGQSGRLAIVALPASSTDEVVPRTAHMDGPVKFDLVRTETPVVPSSAGPPEIKVSTVNGVGDRFDADFIREGDPTLVLAGNVTITASQSGPGGVVTASKATITLDRATTRLKSYEFLGDPATTTIKPAPKVGGAR